MSALASIMNLSALNAVMAFECETWRNAAVPPKK
jgi:hypothetical protein